MKKMLFLLMAATLPSAMWGQNTQSILPNGIAQAQQGQGRASPGVNVCGHSMDAGTFIDARAQNASHEEAVVMRWLDAKGTAVHSGIFMGRCVAKDGDTIDSKIIVRVLPNSVAVSNKHGLTLWEAEYWEFPGEEGRHGTPHRGLFDENRFVTELDPAKASEPGSVSGADPDFRWNEEQESIVLKPGIALLPPPPPIYRFRDGTTSNNGQPPNAPSTPAQTPAPPVKPNCTPQTQQGPKVNVKAPPKVSAWTCQHLGVCPDNKPVVLNPDNGCPAAPTPGQPAK